MNDSAQEWIEAAMGEEIERLEAEVYSDKCSCGAKHDQAGMAAIAAGKLPERGPDCRRLTWKEVAAQNLDTALQRRKEVRAALADLQAAQEERDRLREALEHAGYFYVPTIGWACKRCGLDIVPCHCRFNELAQELERRADRLKPESYAANAYRNAAHLVRQAPHEQEVEGGG